MDVDIDTEKTNPFDSGVENPGYDGTGDEMEMNTIRRGSYDTSSRRGSVETTCANFIWCRYKCYYTHVA